LENSPGRVIWFPWEVGRKVEIPSYQVHVKLSLTGRGERKGVKGADRRKCGKRKGGFSPFSNLSLLPCSPMMDDARKSHQYQLHIPDMESDAEAGRDLRATLYP